MSNDRISDVIFELKKISDRQSKKTVTMWIQPIDENWFHELHFSDDELDLTNELTEELNHLMEFRVSMPLFSYKEA